jgi:1-deoxy-D-xylulose-5-phosphate synthase
MTVMAPKDEGELRQMLYTALAHPGPVAIRYPRSPGVGVTLDDPYRKIPLGEAEILREGTDHFIFALGSMVYPSLSAAEALEKEGLTVGVINCRFIKPLDDRLFTQTASRSKILVIEENIRQGGFGGAVLELLNDRGVQNIRLKRIGLPDKFVEHGSIATLHRHCGLDAQGIKEAAGDFFRQP